MQIVIDIPEWLYNSLPLYSHNDMTAATACILNHSKILPKGHGDLKDASKMIADLNTVKNDNYADTVEWACNVINSYPTIIEADKEG